MMGKAGFGKRRLIARLLDSGFPAAKGGTLSAGPRPSKGTS